MLLQRLAPGVEDGDSPDLAPEVPGIGPEGGEGGPRGVEEEPIQDPGITLRERVQGMRQREDDVEVLHRQQRRLPRPHPARLGEGLALRAVPVPTRVVGDAERPAVITRFRVPAQGGRPAGPDGPEGAVLPAGQAVGLPVRRPVGPDEVREFDPARRAYRAHR